MRFKSVEMATTDGTWGSGKQLELIAPQAISAASAWERSAAASMELAELSLREKTHRGSRLE